MEQNKTDSGLSPEELEEAIADYIAKKNAATTSTDGDTATGETTPAPDGEVAAVKPEEQADEEDVVQSVKERRDRRDAETASNSKETALETITQQDADIDALLKLIEQLKAKSDFADANADSDDTSKTDCGTIQKDGDESKSQSLNLDSAAVDRLVASKIDVIRIADKLHLDGVDVMSVKDGKKAVIKSVYPEMRLDGKSDDYIDALYDLTKQKIKGDNNTDKQRKQMFNKDAAPAEEQSVTGADAARNRMIEKQKNGGK